MPANPEYPTAAPFVPGGADLSALATAAAGCRGCGLYRAATQTVFGDGGADARVALVGEQPGDVEDRRGLPFVGPAGKLLDKALADAGIDRRAAYVTNAVKHFKFTMATNGKRRIHAKPDAYEVAACKPWLAAELAVLDPEVVVCLGATAALSLLGTAFRVTRSRGVLMPWPPESGEPTTLFADAEDGGRKSAFVLATIHPSAVLRADDGETAYAGLVADLRVVAEALAA